MIGFIEFLRTYLTKENIADYKRMTHKLVFLSGLTGLPVDHNYIMRLDIEFCNCLQKEKELEKQDDEIQEQLKRDIAKIKREKAADRAWMKRYEW